MTAHVNENESGRRDTPNAALDGALDEAMRDAAEALNSTLEAVEAAGEVPNVNEAEIGAQTPGKRGASRLNPIFESSARRRMRTIRTPAIVTAYLIALLCCSVSQLAGFFGQGVTVTAMRQGIETYIWMTALQFLLIVLVAPALGAGSIAGERERQTFDLLLVTGVGVRRIVLGKLLENFAFLALLIFSGAPVLALALVTGGVTVLDLLTTLVYLMLIALAALSVGMVMSAIFRRSLSAVIASYIAVLALGAGTWALAKQGPLAASYSWQTLSMLPAMRRSELLALVPPMLYLNPAIGLVTMLASQTGILHRTMQETLRLYDIYSVFGQAGFGWISLICFAAIAVAAALLIALSVVLLHAQTGRAHFAGRRKARASKAA